MTRPVNLLSHDCWEILHDFILARYLRGECYEFAIALQEGLGWPMIGMVDGDKIYHVVVRDPEGTYWDARGKVEENNLGEPFSRQPPYELKMIERKDLEDIQPANETAVKTASRMAQILWPHLPWKDGTLLKRILAFVSDLEALSQKHGFWIFSSLPTMLPLIAEGEGDEKGYALGALPNGIYTINRKIT